MSSSSSTTFFFTSPSLTCDVLQRLPLLFLSSFLPHLTIDKNYRVITLILKIYGNLPLCLENCALFSMPPIFTTILYTYPLRHILYIEEPSGKIISNYHGTFIHIFMHGYYHIYQKKISKPSFFIIHAREHVSKDDTSLIHLKKFLILLPFMIQYVK